MAASTVQAQPPMSTPAAPTALPVTSELCRVTGPAVFHDHWQSSPVPAYRKRRAPLSGAGASVPSAAWTWAPVSSAQAPAGPVRLQRAVPGTSRSRAKSSTLPSGTRRATSSSAVFVPRRCRQGDHEPSGFSCRVFTVCSSLRMKTCSVPSSSNAATGKPTWRPRSGSARCGLPSECHGPAGRPVWYCVAHTTSTATAPPARAVRRSPTSRT
ncbi:hypothetical protein [Streptomyces sp. NBC_01089]|uniref:hypothetical protein n=1 Tax=Streptomyces sp. NBC_01089 TaxID=2903747 RepID=UPI0038638F16|nr:hypothetical protein OG510_07385 [Streptomyces sp. NBC_01089]